MFEVVESKEVERGPAGSTRFELIVRCQGKGWKAVRYVANHYLAAGLCNVEDVVWRELRVGVMREIEREIFGER